jgi:hypothetical protein
MYLSKEKYYETNGAKMKVYETNKYIKEHPTGLIRSYKKQQLENKIILV